MKIQIYRRADGKWAWRLIARNGRIIATDGGQGYSRRSACISSAMLSTGYFSDWHYILVKRPSLTFVDELGRPIKVVGS